MPQTWEFINKDADCTPDIVLKATNPITNGEKVLLFNVLNGCFGEPVITSGTQANGMATEIIIGFNGNGTTSINNLLNKLNNSALKLSWINTDIRTVYTPHKVVIKSLNVKLPEFNLVQNFSPVLIVERYKPAKYKGYDVNGQKEYRPAGYKWDGAIYPITQEKQSINIHQESYFNVSNVYVSSRGVKQFRNYNYSGSLQCKAWQYLQFRIRITVNGTNYLSNPLQKIKMNCQKTSQLNYHTISYQEL